MKTLLLLNGANLNLLGVREPDVYGDTALEDIVQNVEKLVKAEGWRFEHFQTNHEGALLDRIHEAMNEVDFIVINPAAFQNSVALRDALSAVRIPFVEVHLSNIFAREEFRRKSLLGDIACGVITGMGAMGYEFAARFGLNRDYGD